MLMKFFSPLTAEFFPNEPDWENESYNEYEGCPLDGHDLLQYADAVDEAVKKDIADFNGDLMQYYHEDDSVRSKVVSAVPSVEICGNKLCGCLTVELKETLLDDEQTVLCNYISGQYSDDRDIEAAIARGDQRAALAWDMRTYQVLKYVGAYIAVLGGLDALVFTAGIGENQPRVRQEIIDALGFLGMKCDTKANEVHGKETLITTADSAIPAWVIPTDEEMVIARDTAALTNG